MLILHHDLRMNTGGWSIDCNALFNEAPMRFSGESLYITMLKDRPIRNLKTFPDVGQGNSRQYIQNQSNQFSMSKICKLSAPHSSNVSNNV